MSKISIESKPVAFGFDHLYLVFEDDFGKEFVIRGGPENNNPIDFGDIVTEVSVPIEESEDERDLDEKTDRGNRELDLGERRAEDVWAIMKQQATNIHNETINYNALNSAQNSNSTIASVLNTIGIVVDLNIPLNTEKDELPGVSNLLSFDTNLVGTNANDTILGYEGNDNLSGGGGNDVIDGGIGSDLLSGNSGDDILRAGFGQDHLVGGEGGDIFGFYALGHYVVQDFNLVEDRIFFDSVKTGLSNINEVNQSITSINQRVDGVKIEFGPNASIDLIGINFTDLTTEMVGFAA